MSLGDLLTSLALALGLGLGAVVVYRMNEVFCLSVRDGKTIVVRGRIPRSVYASLSDVARRAEIRRATIRVVAGEHHARLSASGVDQGTEQRLRNAFGVHPIQRLRSASAPTRRNLGQILGIAALAWMLSDRRG
jgi:Protein of unknown function (DUF3634)